MKDVQYNNAMDQKFDILKALHEYSLNKNSKEIEDILQQAKELFTQQELEVISKTLNISFKD